MTQSEQASGLYISSDGVEQSVREQPSIHCNPEDRIRCVFHDGMWEIRNIGPAPAARRSWLRRIWNAITKRGRASE